MYLKTAAFLAASLFINTAALAQAADSKKSALARQIVKLQQGPELDRLVQQLSTAAVQPEAVRWGQNVAANVPKEQQQKIVADIDVELRKFAADAQKIIQEKLKVVAEDVLVPAYTERFTEEELQQLVAFFGSPAVRKYQEVAPQIANQLVQKVVEASKPGIVERAKTFNAAAGKILPPPPKK
jgi:uncharacterized protein